jgi:hypothetical protein
VGFGTEILFMLLLGLLVLGPKRLHAMLGHVARAKAQLENALRPAILSDSEEEANECHKRVSYYRLTLNSYLRFARYWGQYSEPPHQRFWNCGVRRLSKQGLPAHLQETIRIST